jgi:hypothetical protein
LLKFLVTGLWSQVSCDFDRSIYEENTNTGRG